MTDFTNGKTTPQESTEGTTNFSQASETNQQVSKESEDKAVLLELDGRKFTKEDIVKKITNADSFIEQLKQERAEDRKMFEELKQQMSANVNAEDVLKQIRQEKEAQPSPVKEVNPDEITKSVLSQLERQRLQEQENRNWQEVTATLTKTFGDKTNNRVAEVAQENGFTLEEAADFAKRKPKAFMKLFPELQPSKVKNSGLTFGNNSATGVFGNKPKPSSTGYSNARVTKDLVSVYQKKLQEFSERNDN